LDQYQYKLLIKSLEVDATINPGTFRRLPLVVGVTHWPAVVKREYPDIAANAAMQLAYIPAQLLNHAHFFVQLVANKNRTSHPSGSSATAAWLLFDLAALKPPQKNVGTVPRPNN
jgi:hypothetical protein